MPLGLPSAREKCSCEETSDRNIELYVTDVNLTLDVIWAKIMFRLCNSHSHFVSVYLYRLSSRLYAEPRNGLNTFCFWMSFRTQ